MAKKLVVGRAIPAAPLQAPAAPGSVEVALADPVQLARTERMDPGLLASMRGRAAATQAAPDATALQQLAALVARHDELAVEVTLLEGQLADRRRELGAIVADRIPALMSAAGVQSFVTASGRKVEVGDAYSASLARRQGEPEEDHARRRGAALEWLRRAGHDGIVKRQLSVALGRGAADAAVAALVEAARAAGFAAEVAEDVHPSTLRAFVRERMEAPVDPGLDPQLAFPADLFLAERRRVATVKAAKR